MAELSCTEQGKSEFNVAASSAKGLDKDDALFNLMDAIVKQAADKGTKCDDKCSRSGLDVFCFATVVFKEDVQYRRITGKGVIAQYSGDVVLQCHCFGVIDLIF